jgi:hypothetical protein
MKKAEGGEPLAFVADARNQATTWASLPLA